MNKQEIKEILNKKYNKEKLKLLTKDIFKNVEYFKEAKLIKTDNKKILNFFQIVNINLKDKKKNCIIWIKINQKSKYL